MDAVLPETKTEVKKEVPSRQEQLVWLRNYLMGNKTFGSLRAGRFRKDALSILYEVSQGDNWGPMDFCRGWDEHVAEARIMGNKLAQLKRDGWNDAFRELESALNGAYVIEGEDIPLEQTTPVTILVFEPELTFDLFR